MALDAFCGELWWDYQVSWNTSNPDFTQCFQKTVLVWVPCGFLWLFAPLETFYLLKSKTKNIPWTALNISKLVISVILALLCIVSLSYSSYYTLHQGKDVPLVDFYEPFIKLISFSLVICFVIAGRLKGLQSSGVLFLFWFILMLCEFMTYRSYIMHSIDSTSVTESFRFILFMIYYPFVVVEFLLSCFADGKPQYTEYSVEDEKESPECSASFLSRLLFWWFNGFVITGWKRPLVADDLWSLNYEDQCTNVFPIFDKYWNEELQKVKMSVKSASYSPRRSSDDVKFTGLEPKSKPTIVRALSKAFGGLFLHGAIFKLFNDLLQFVSPQVLKLLIDYISSDEPLWKGIFYTILMFVAATLQSVMISFYFHRMYIVAMRMRTSLTSTIYRKALLLSNSSKRKSTVGEIVNLMAVDVQKFMDLIPFLNLIWSSPLQIILALVFLWDVLGPSVLAGLVVMLLVIPVNGFIASQSKKLQVKQMKSKDERVKLMNEILGGMKVLKLYAWEESFQDQVLNIRNKELQRLKKTAYLNAVMSFVWTCAPYLVSLTSFATFVLSDPNNVLDAKRAFVALTLFQILRFPLSMLPMLISMLVQATVSIKRINDFLTNEELEKYVEHDQTDQYALAVEHGTFSWHKEDPMVLKNISLNIPIGSLIAVVGQVGAGKSSLLSALLGDMEKIEGRVNTKGSIAYVPQQAWIQNATLRDNILFYQIYQKDKYLKVVEACALKPDFSILPGEDLTEVGEKGINLSGGQKQRISLARAAYNNADVYLLDDPLSAVDSHVGRHIFENVIGPKGLLKDKTRVLVTHGITYLRQTDMIVVMKDGVIEEVGSYQELLRKKGAFADFLLQYLKDDVEEAVEELEDQDISIVEEIINTVGSPEISRQLSVGGSDADISNRNKKDVIRSLSRQLSQISHDSGQSEILQKRSGSSRLDKRESSPREENGIKNAVSDGKLHEKNGSDSVFSGNENAKLILVETAETGQVKAAVYIRYIQALGIMWVVLLSIGYIALQSFSVGSNIWLSAWSNDAPNPDGTQNIDVRDLRLGVYAVLGFCQGVAVLLGTMSLAYGTIRASRLLHQDLLIHILRSPMSFFETTPLGRIVNRFSKDVDTVDTTIPMTIRSWMLCFLQVVATIIVISLETPIFLSIVVPVGILYYFIQKFYVSTSRQLKRLESITKSPIYSHFSETLAGVTTIRGYGAQKLFIQESDKLVDFNQTCFYPSVVANRWLAIRLEFCGNCIIFFSALFAVLGKNYLSPGSVGLSVSYALSVTATLNWLVRMTSEMETNIVAVERIEEYTTTPTEAALDIASTKPPRSWPSDGNILFEKYSTRYRDGLDLVLKGISCDIKPGVKVGIVGRTGAGKSSLTLSLFRLIEAVNGRILIDGVDISKIGLRDLRSNITIIPQDPVLFSGTLRMNLDPFCCYSDDEVWIALEHSHLKNFVSSLSAGLQHLVSEGGENLSVGQRQLICLARALLRKTKVLVLDEATAAVDLETDDLIQSTIRTEFANCTILTIAHRLNTIMDYDKVMVLDKGVIREFDSPSILLENKESVFHAMAKDAGLV